MLFIDTAKRLNQYNLFSLTPGLNRVVYLDEIKVEALTIKDVSILKQQTYDMMEAGLLRYKAH